MVIGGPLKAVKPFVYTIQYGTNDPVNKDDVGTASNDGNGQWNGL